MTKQIRLCEVALQYTDGDEETTHTYLDLGSSIKDQVYESFNPLPSDSPKILSFKILAWYTQGAHRRMEYVSTPSNPSAYCNPDWIVNITGTGDDACYSTHVRRTNSTKETQ